jgi:hypothetical protein
MLLMPVLYLNHWFLLSVQVSTKTFQIIDSQLPCNCRTAKILINPFKELISWLSSSRNFLKNATASELKDVFQWGIDVC